MTTGGVASKRKAPARPSKKRTTKRKKLSKEELEARRVQRRQYTQVRNIFAGSGFKRVPQASDVEFTFDGTTSDVDDIFISENIVVLVEYTTTKSSAISGHLKKKAFLYSKIERDPKTFVEYASGAPLFATSEVLKTYMSSQVEVRILYCSRQKIDKDLKEEVEHCIYLDHEVVQYLHTVVGAIRTSARTELLAFLGVVPSKYGSQAHQPGSVPAQVYRGSVLPEDHSRFPKGYKIVSFYMDPESLLKRAYVLRRDGWREGGALYQRLIQKSKIESMRKYLTTHERVFVNNIIVTLPPETRILDENTNTVEPGSISLTSPANVSIPDAFNSVGIIDGQHRLFCYHEGGVDDDQIKVLRKQQNLLVTGIVYPAKTSPLEREAFEARLFLEINSTQTNAKSELRQAINRIIQPFADASIARAVQEELNERGPLAGMFQRYVFETQLMKTTTVVSYGLRPLVRIGGPLFRVWKNGDKDRMVEDKDDVALAAYVQFCVKSINAFLGPAREAIGSDRWAIKTRKSDGVVTTTLVNGLLGALRQQLDQDVQMTPDQFRVALKGLDKFDFGRYKSSQYTVMSTDIAAAFLT